MISIDRERRPHVALLVALLLGAAIRGCHTFSADFPLNDGGLFYVMVRDLQEAHYRLPAYTSYNGAGIPFGYSPFAFYVTGLLNDITGIDLLTLFRVLPWAASTACIVAFHPLAREMLAREVETSAVVPGDMRGGGARGAAVLAAALIAFAVVPRGFVWLIMGGGLTRSFGYLFALLALHQVWLLYTRRSLRYVPLASLFSALTVLSHLGTAPFVAFSALLFLLFCGRHREGLLGSALIGVGTLALTAPWWATVMGMHGTAPFLAARATGGSVLSTLSAGGPGAPEPLQVLGQVARGTTGEGWFPLIWVLALVGIAWCVRERRLLLPAWTATILLLDTRAGFTYAAAPVAMLAGMGAVALVWPLPASRERSPLRLPRARLAVLGLLLAVSIVVAARRTDNFAAETKDLTALSPSERAAMRWTAANTDTTARVLVLTRTPWQIDKTSEWFPVLAERASVATVQGTEWLPAGAFPTSIGRQQRVAECTQQATTCLDALRDDPALHYTHVYVPTADASPCCGPLLDAMHRDARFGMIYRNDAATIFERHELLTLSPE